MAGLFEKRLVIHACMKPLYRKLLSPYKGTGRFPVPH